MWARIPIETQVVNANTAAALVAPTRFDVLQQFEQSLGASSIGVTVVALRGIMWFTPSATEAIRWRVTMHVDDDADVGNQTANDNTFSNTAANRDHFFFEPFTSFPSETASSTDVTKRMIYNKSSRKLEELNQTIFLDVSGLTLVGADSATFGADLSALLLLP